MGQGWQRGPLWLLFQATKKRQGQESGFTGTTQNLQMAIQSADRSQRGSFFRSSRWQEAAVCLFVGHLGVENCVCESQRWERDPGLLWSELMQIRPLTD